MLQCSLPEILCWVVQGEQVEQRQRDRRQEEEEGEGRQKGQKEGELGIIQRGQGIGHKDLAHVVDEDDGKKFPWMNN